MERCIHGPRLALRLGVSPPVVVEDLHVEARGPPGDPSPDAAHADDPERAPVHLRAQEEARIETSETGAPGKAVSDDHVPRAQARRIA